MKIIELLNAQPTMQELINRKMHHKLAFALAKNFRLINAELEDYNKTRLKILSENWNFDEKDSKYNIPDEELPRWNKMHAELVEMESGYIPYKIDLSLTETSDWTPGELMAMWFIFEGEGASDLAPIVKNAVSDQKDES